jgi:hypothetical protein
MTSVSSGEAARTTTDTRSDDHLGDDHRAAFTRP